MELIRIYQKLLKHFGKQQYIISKYKGSLNKFFNRSTEEIRRELLSLEGIGLETADSILLYAADRLTCPIDADKIMQAFWGKRPKI